MGGPVWCGCLYEKREGVAFCVSVVFGLGLTWLLYAEK